ncbi:MAG: hypothetical protein ISS76_12685 [Phycisphaerae bacterium]|nr:hypothetical protein [Phycisphaerae bacterium]
MNKKDYKVFLEDILKRIEEKPNSTVFSNLYNTLKQDELEKIYKKNIAAETKRAIELLYPVYLINNSNFDVSYKKATLTIYWTAFNEVYSESKINWFNINIKDYPPYENERIKDYGTRILYKIHIRLEKQEFDIDGWLLLSNYCPVLEACKTLKLDTKRICKIGFYKQYQVLLDKIAEHYNEINNIKNGKTLKLCRYYSEMRSPFSKCKFCKEKVDDV